VLGRPKDMAPKRGGVAFLLNKVKDLTRSHLLGRPGTQRQFLGAYDVQYDVTLTMSNASTSNFYNSNICILLNSTAYNYALSRTCC